MADREVQHRLAAILVADVAGYTRLMEEDTDGTVAAWQNAREDVIKPQVDSHSGKIVKLTGDGFLVEFHTVQDAVKCAIALQNGLKSNSLDFRMGVNLGDIVDDGEDIHGEGVNVAARIEALADAGGISISGSVYEQIRNRIDVHYEDRGEHDVKNVSAPVRVFAIRQKSVTDVTTTDPADKPSAIRKSSLAASIAIVIVAAVGLVYWQPWVTEFKKASIERKAISLPDRPSIAVLPFLNLSNDPNQEYFVDGMTEDLITDLAKIKSLFVIARNTVFTYKGKSVVVPDVARELGIKYVLEGSVRRVGEVVRINAQLIDGASGAHIWAQRYDGKLTDIFDLQDKVTSEIVEQLQIKLTLDEKNLHKKKDTDSTDAYDAYLRGWQLYRRHTPEDFFKAIAHLERAVKLDPDFGRAWATLASIYWTAYRNGMAWSFIVKPNNSQNINMSWIGARDKAEIYLRKAKRNPTPLAHQIASLIWSDFRRFDEGILEAEKAVALDPNDPEGHLAMAWALIFAGHPKAAIPFAENAIRLDPYFPATYRFALGTAQLMLKHYAAAETILKAAFELNPQEMEILAPLAVAYARLGKNGEAKAALQKYTDFWRYFAPKIEAHLVFWTFKRETDIRLFGGGLIKAGLCCDDQLEKYIGKLRKGGTLE